MRVEFAVASPSNCSPAVPSSVVSAVAQHGSAMLEQSLVELLALPSSLPKPCMQALLATPLPLRRTPLARSSTSPLHAAPRTWSVGSVCHAGNGCQAKPCVVALHCSYLQVVCCKTVLHSMPPCTVQCRTSCSMSASSKLTESHGHSTAMGQLRLPPHQIRMHSVLQPTLSLTKRVRVCQVFVEHLGLPCAMNNTQRCPPVCPCCSNLLPPGRCCV